MYIDVKNTNPEDTDLGNSYIQYSNGKEQSHFSKLQKMWKPLRNLIRFNSKSRKTVSTRRHIEFSSIPNNIYLNNTVNQANNSYTEQTFSVNESEAANAANDEIHESYANDDENYQNIAEQLKAFEMKQIRETHEITQIKQLITSATIEKVPSSDQCTSCIYGKNCQHKQSLPWPNANPPANSHFSQSAENCLETHREAEVLNCWQDLLSDDKVLRDWLAHNYQQISKYMPLPEPPTM